MNDDELTASEQELSGKKKKKGEGETQSGKGRESVQVSEAAQELMRERGLSMQQITDVLKNWKHLGGKEIAVRLAEFGRDAAKASAHITVSFSRDAGFAVLTQFLKQVQRLGSLTRKLSADNRRVLQKKHDINLG